MGYNENTPILRSEINQQDIRQLRCKNLIIIPIILVFSIPNGMVTYIVPEYLHDRLTEKNQNQSLIQNWTYSPCVSNKSGPQYEQYTHVQEEIAKWQNYYGLIRGIPAIVTSLIWASYSDVIGRRTLMFLCTFGYFLKFTGMSLVVHFNAHIAFLLIGETIDGLLGSMGTFLAVLFAYIADVTELGRKRTIGIVLTELMLGIAFTGATVGTGYVIKDFGYFYSSLTGACFAGTSVLLILFFLPETLHHRKPGGVRKVISSISEPFKFYFKQDSKIKQLKYVMLIVAFLLYTMQSLNRGSIEALYQLGKPFCWSSTKIGWFGAARVGSITLAGMGLILVLKRVFADDTIAVVSAALTVVSYVVEGLAQTEAVIFTVPVLAVMSILPIPIIRSLLSHLTPEEKQGAVFASIGGVETMCNLLGALTGNLVYSATLSIMDGFVFLIFGALAAVSGIILWVYRCVERKYPEEDHTGNVLVN